MARSLVGKDVRAEKSKICEWVKLPAPSTTHMHPSLFGVKDFPDTADSSAFGCGVAEGCRDEKVEAGEAEAETGAEGPQLPKVD